jgi:hypothetical protein
MNKSESIKELATALASLQSEIQNPKNTADNPFYHSKYAPLPDILTMARPLLSKHGLSVIQSPGGDGQHITISTLLMHKSGEWIELEPLTLTAEKLTPQGAGSAITYGRRYTISALLGISSEDDDDGNSLEGKRESNQGAEPHKNLSEAQVKRLFAIANSKGYNAESVKKAALKKYNVTEIAQLTKQQYDEMCNGYEGLPDKQ